jgi:hypothetical protein
MIMRYAVILLATFVMACCAGKKSAHYRPVSFEEGDTTILAGATNPLWGRWLIYKYEWGGITEWSKAEADAELGRELILYPDSCMFGNTPCKSPVYLRHEDNAAHAFWCEDFTNPDKLGVKSKKIAIVEVICDSAEANSPAFSWPYEIFVINEQQIILPGSGIYFFLRKEDR